MKIFSIIMHYFRQMRKFYKIGLSSRTMQKKVLKYRFIFRCVLASINLRYVLSKKWQTHSFLSCKEHLNYYKQKLILVQAIMAITFLATGNENSCLSVYFGIYLHWNNVHSFFGCLGGNTLLRLYFRVIRLCLIPFSFFHLWQLWSAFFFLSVGNYFTFSFLCIFVTKVSILRTMAN